MTARHRHETTSSAMSKCFALSCLCSSFTNACILYLVVIVHVDNSPLLLLGLEVEVPLEVEQVPLVDLPDPQKQPSVGLKKYSEVMLRPFTLKAGRKRRSDEHELPCNTVGIGN